MLYQNFRRNADGDLSRGFANAANADRTLDTVNGFWCKAKFL